MSYRAIVSFLTLVGLFAGSLFCHAQTTASCTFSTFNPPKGYVSPTPDGINNYDTIVGSVFTTPTPFTIVSHGLIRYSNGSMQVYNYPGATKTSLSRRNDSGVTVGYFTDSTGHRHGLVKYSKSAVSVT